MEQKCIKEVTYVSSKSQSSWCMKDIRLQVTAFLYERKTWRKTRKMKKKRLSGSPRHEQETIRVSGITKPFLITGDREIARETNSKPRRVGQFARALQVHMWLKVTLSNSGKHFSSAKRPSLNAPLLKCGEIKIKQAKLDSYGKVIRRWKERKVG